ncbi:hypothetical protein M885DRAFT_534893 [Pelagophyceae sp. CCMP2097]|nr:hypothetical protein M885DRAFT_534893 [Pelagophyceae sp. CCMP2097]
MAHRGRFDPANLLKKKEKRLAVPRVEAWINARLPESMRDLVALGRLRISIREVYCGDPACAPVDTVIEFTFDGTIRGEVGLPYEVDQLQKEDFVETLPPDDVLQDWARGKETVWPPEVEVPQNVPLRFLEQARVECCVGRDEWLAGNVVKLWYREPGFPPGFFAPYQVHLDDGRLIFAPEDSERCIRVEQTA